MSGEEQIHDLGAQQLRQVVRTLIAEAAGKDREIAFKQAFIDKLTHEMAVLKRLKFAAQSEAYLTTPIRGACSKKPSTPTWPRWPPRSSVQRRHHKARTTNKDRSASRCPRTCRAAKSSTSPKTPPAAVAAN